MKSYPAFSNNRVFYESTFNLLYITMRHTPSPQKTSLIKRDSKEEKPFSNLFIWDINTQTKNALFSNEIARTESIQKILFEKEYHEENQRLLFNEETNLLNNKAIPYRNLKNKLLVETYHIESKTRHLWLSNKQGNNLSMVATLHTENQWHLDIGNGILRIIKYLKTDIEVQEIAW
ncbi:hypothetical protein [Aureispira sp. CCB-E]|uniref:hypothetical protein n=1 Tax=Aureispira sp. CCB-E TaxID=3051121 RepID=UPI0028694E3C|nr:hypothetical protein [Aureispira sp. CCB-E]WMX15349.1 hypothetical protein QP953_03050 [Aureispira sp. CCB-E]